MSAYGTFDNYNDYITQQIRDEISIQSKRIDPSVLKCLVFVVGGMALQLLYDILITYNRVKNINYSYIKILEIAVKLVSIVKSARLLHQKMQIHENVQSMPPIDAIITHPQSYVHINIPTNSVMNTSEITRGFAMLAQAISSSNQATLRGLDNLEQRINARMDNRIDDLEQRINTRMDNRIDDLEQRINTRMDTGFTTLVALINERIPATKN